MTESRTRGRSESPPAPAEAEGDENGGTPANATDGAFDPRAIEGALYAEWERAGHFAPSGNGPPYCIAIPPPNVTDRLHIGHAFQHTLMDALIRYHRMEGNRTLWQTGTDHAQIATQMVVERQLLAQGTSRTALGREAFIDKVWAWKRGTGAGISGQIRRMGSSVDWTRERFTMDAGFSRAVIEVFVRLFEEGLIYRGKRLVNWDPTLGTSISDLEVDNVEERGHLWHFRYPLANGAYTDAGADHLVVATTRPETMLGDTAVAVHPEDPRHRSLVGKAVRLPLAERDIPVIADAHVDAAFGSGCVKITPAHDFDDHAIGARHDLPLINIFTAEARLNDNGPAPYRGLDRFEARRRIVADMQAAGLLERVEEITHTVPRGDRSEAVIEPWLTDQWFVKIAPLAGPAIRAVENGDVRFVPQQYENMYFAWLRDIQDWCISRQQWWGHRIPAWYDDAGNIYVARTEAEARARHGLAASTALRQDEDVLDTWFSSALWTFGTLGWPERTPELAAFHPTTALVTGYDIIFFWVARMIMMTLKFTGEVPFRTVYIHGMVRDATGAKMSKTRGNGLDPLDLIDGVTTEDLVAKRTANMTQPKMAAAIAARTRKEYPHGIPAYGTDALRFTFCAMASQGRDLAFHLKRIEGYRNFCNKLWNAAKFVLAHGAAAHDAVEPAPSLADRWIRARLGQLVAASKQAIGRYRFDLYANAVYEFAWHEYCDWYVELTKPVLFDEGADPAAAAAARRTLADVLEALLRIAHPIVPFVTETLWRRVAPAATGRAGQCAATIMRQPFPAERDFPPDAYAQAALDWLKDMVTALRNIRGEMNVAPGTAVLVLLQGAGNEERALLAALETPLKRLGKVSELQWLPPDAAPPAAAAEMVGELKVLVPLAGVVDAHAERARLGKEMEKVGKERARVDGKLANANFLAKAPAAVVAKERAKGEALRKRFDVLGEQLRRLEAL